NAEIRRQIHIQSEQKRRAQIKDGFEELKCHLPNCSNKKISKAAILYKTVQYLQHLKNIQIALIGQLEHMGAENERLKQFCDAALQKQSLEKVYSIGL
ncbi:HLH-domain-containing protein, partial [Basidiobolus meristosporus CBS 931.73]